MKSTNASVTAFERCDASLSWNRNRGPLYLHLSPAHYGLLIIGNPELRLALNEDLVVGKGNGAGGFGAVVLDVSIFHVSTIEKENMEKTKVNGEQSDTTIYRDVELD